MYLQLKKYFSDLADQNIHIKDKVGYFSREIAEKERSFNGIASPFLAIYDYELGLDGGELNTMGRRKITFSIIYANAPHDNSEAQQELISKAEAIALQCLARIRWDNHQKGHFLFNSFEKDLTKIYPVEDPQAHFFGVDVEVHFKTPTPLEVKQEDWTVPVGCK